MTEDWVHGVGHFPVYQILLQIVVRAMITSSQHGWTSSAGTLSTPADFLFFSGCTAASTSLRRMGWSSSVSARGQSSTTDPHRPCDHTAKRSTLPTGPAPPPIETEKKPTYKSIMAYTSAIYQHAAHTTDQLSSPSWYTGAIPSSLSLDEKH